MVMKSGDLLVNQPSFDMYLFPLRFLHLYDNNRRRDSYRCPPIFVYLLENLLTGILSVGTPQNCVGNSNCSKPVVSQFSLATVLAMS